MSVALACRPVEGAVALLVNLAQVSPVGTENLKNRLRLAPQVITKHIVIITG